MSIPPRSLTALLMGDPLPDRIERAEALRLSLPEPVETPLEEWLKARKSDPISDEEAGDGSTLVLS